MWKWKFLCWLIRNLSRGEHLQGHLLAFREAVCRQLNHADDRWLSYNVRLKTPVPSKNVAAAIARVGVVIQGQVMTDEGFTLRTVDHYRRTFPGCPIFVSTWTDESGEIVRSLERAGAVVLLSDLPDFPAPSNINYQLRSTLAGVEAARAAGCRFVLKTRTDTRMYAANIPNFLVRLIEHFPVGATCGATGRLVVLDWATRLFIPQHPSDLMMFGYVEDMVNYWSAALCQSPQNSARPVCRSFEELLNSLIPEVYLCRQYLGKIGYSFEPTLASWWKCLADLFVVVDRTALGHLWLKYNYATEQHKTLDEHRRNEALCSFRDWLAIMNFDKQPCFDVPALLAQVPNGHLPQVA